MPRNFDLMKTDHGYGLFRETKGVISLSSYILALNNLHLHRDLSRTSWAYSKPTEFLLPREFLE